MHPCVCLESMLLSGVYEYTMCLSYILCVRPPSEKSALQNRVDRVKIEWRWVSRVGSCGSMSATPLFDIEMMCELWYALSRTLACSVVDLAGLASWAPSAMTAAVTVVRTSAKFNLAQTYLSSSHHLPLPPRSSLPPSLLRDRPPGTLAPATLDARECTLLR